ncbi:hypothetical protein [Mangrovicoccus sp. HB161399]|uniref:hypothetical protein n=1 Tax=Mangrovicoccus sp. HB161399 TaxID=2720392 RepID=UPI00155476F4|nr:hypothetical protein [Mangrovicoccus sp. HB161399]
MIKALFAALATIAGLSAAQAGDPFFPGMKSWDSYYTEDGLKLRIVNHKVMYPDGTQATYRRDGTYLFQTSDADPGVTGRYTIRPYGMICVKFDKGGARCDTYVRAMQDTVFLTGGGERMKVKALVDLTQSSS